ISHLQGSRKNPRIISHCRHLRSPSSDVQIVIVPFASVISTIISICVSHLAPPSELFVSSLSVYLFSLFWGLLISVEIRFSFYCSDGSVEKFITCQNISFHYENIGRVQSIDTSLY
uniref:Uncharacterized protein n=1 Tax=Cucumis melo TaxID=3656 RepID=A0A9I9EKE3_CUCME